MYNCKGKFLELIGKMPFDRRFHEFKGEIKYNNNNKVNGPIQIYCKLPKKLKDEIGSLEIALTKNHVENEIIYLRNICETMKVDGYQEILERMYGKEQYADTVRKSPFFFRMKSVKPNLEKSHFM